jgi:hypothetical protein
MTGLNAHFDEPLSASSPTFDQPAAIGNFREKRVARPRCMLALQVIDGEPERQGSGAGDLKPVVENGDAYGSAGDRIVAMTECIEQRFS